jgi:hypothetical protein
MVSTALLPLFLRKKFLGVKNKNITICAFATI